MALQAVDFKPSSNIQQIDYDPEAQELVVAFKSGGTYRYDGVSQNMADGFANAESAGKYLHTFVKGQHVATKIG